MIWVLPNKTSGLFIPLSQCQWDKITPLFSSIGTAAINTESALHAACTCKKIKSLLPKLKVKIR